MKLRDAWVYPHTDPSVHLFDEAVRMTEASVDK